MTTTEPATFANPHALIGQPGPLGVSEWVTLDQNRINGFADCTEDHQWIHIDTERAKSGPFGTTIAHGYLTLSLVPRFLEQVVHVNDTKAVVNYGTNKVRFTAPVPSGSRVRGHLSLVSANARGASVEAVFGLTVEVEGGERPAVVAELVILYT